MEISLLWGGLLGFCVGYQSVNAWSQGIRVGVLLEQPPESGRELQDWSQRGVKLAWLLFLAKSDTDRLRLLLKLFYYYSQ